MEFVVFSKDEFHKIEDDFYNSNFYQTSEWADIKEKNGWEHFYVGVKEKNKYVLICLLLARSVLGRRFFYAPRGPVMDFSNKELLEFFVENLKKFVKKNKGFVFKFDPYIEYQERDKNGEPVGVAKDEYWTLLKKLGFTHRGFTRGYSDEAQFRWSYALDIKDKTFDDLLPDMDQRCRRCIRKCEKYPLEVFDVNDDNIKDFKDIMNHTAKRQDHFDRSTEYYKNLKKYLKDKVSMVVVCLNRKKFLKDFKDDKMYEEIEKLDVDYVPITAGVFIFDNDKFNYVYGGTYSYYMSFMAQYKMQVEMIKKAIDKKLDKYDFGGISGVFEPNTKNYGVYEFKRGFGGRVIEYIGEFDLVTDKLFYAMYKAGYWSYGKLKSIKSKLSK